MKELSDYELIKLHGQGNPDALGILLKRHEGLIYLIIKRYPKRSHIFDDDDLYQIAVERIIKYISSHDPSKGKFSTFLGFVSRGAILTAFQREKKHRKTFSLESKLENPDDAVELESQLIDDSVESEDEIVDNIVVDEIIKKASRHMRPKIYEIFKMRFQEGLSYIEIAKQLGVSHQYPANAMREAIKQHRETFLYD